MNEIALQAGLSVETLRKIETGRIPIPAFFTVAALAETLGLSLDGLAVHLAHEDTGDRCGGADADTLALGGCDTATA